ncbi:MULTISPECIES: hypothetical protein [Geobacillus]|nr:MULTISPECIES: hypothetical protein [Geobacillus]MBW7642132.1 hypothetical protein [Geobacillus thermoleovorans]MED4300282.1 hypothetical protein [Geobacillus stearothermophilus]TRY45200.1 hypothetical protein FOI67_00020 [Geobacillus sp. LEMMJ02]
MASTMLTITDRRLFIPMPSFLIIYEYLILHDESSWHQMIRARKPDYLYLLLFFVALKAESLKTANPFFRGIILHLCWIRLSLARTTKKLFTEAPKASHEQLR